MTRTLLTIVLFFAATIASSAQVVPENLSSSCEPSRMQTLPYPSDELAQTYGSEAVASLYLRPITEWEVAEEEDAVVFRAKYIYPFTWLNRQAFLYVEGASGAYEVIINDKLAGSTFNGFAPAEFNITKIQTRRITRLQYAYLRSIGANACIMRPPRRLVSARYMCCHSQQFVCEMWYITPRWMSQARMRM